MRTIRGAANRDKQTQPCPPRVRTSAMSSGRSRSDRPPLLPFGDDVRVDAVALGQRSYARLTLLYRWADRLSRAGAPRVALVAWRALVEVRNSVSSDGLNT